MSAELIAEVIRAHQPTTGMSVASGVTCQCGYWNGNERAGINRPVGYQGLQWHQAQELSAAGFGPVKEAKAEALEDAADKLLDGAPNDFVNQAAATWLRERAESIRSAS